MYMYHPRHLFRDAQFASAALKIQTENLYEKKQQQKIEVASNETGGKVNTKAHSNYSNIC